MRIDPATATFSESTPAASGTETLAAGPSSGGVPPTSLPTTSTQSRRLAASTRSTGTPAESAWRKLTASVLSVAGAPPFPPRGAATSGTWNTPPADARTTLAFQGSTVPAPITTPSSPNPHAERISVPRLPGIRTAAAIR